MGILPAFLYLNLYRISRSRKNRLTWLWERRQSCHQGKWSWHVECGHRAASCGPVDCCSLVTKLAEAAAATLRPTPFWLQMARSRREAQRSPHPAPRHLRQSRSSLPREWSRRHVPSWKNDRTLSKIKSKTWWSTRETKKRRNENVLFHVNSCEFHTRHSLCVWPFHWQLMTWFSACPRLFLKSNAKSVVSRKRRGLWSLAKSPNHGVGVHSSLFDFERQLQASAITSWSYCHSVFLGTLHIPSKKRPGASSRKAGWKKKTWKCHWVILLIHGDPLATAPQRLSSTAPAVQLELRTCPEAPNFCHICEKKQAIFYWCHLFVTSKSMEKRCLDHRIYGGIVSHWSVTKQSGLTCMEIEPKTHGKPKNNKRSLVSCWFKIHRLVWKTHFPIRGNSTPNLNSLFQQVPPDAASPCQISAGQFSNISLLLWVLYHIWFVWRRKKNEITPVRQLLIELWRARVTGMTYRSASWTSTVRIPKAWQMRKSKRLLAV